MPPICTTHPWLTFTIDMRQASPRLWLLLGEARSKCHHLAGVPLSQSVAQDLHQVFLARGVHATAAIEGNMLTERQVLDIVKSNTQPSASQSYAEREISNIVAATNEILDQVEKDGIKLILVGDIKEYNRKILSGLPVDEYVEPGAYAKVQVGVYGYKGAPTNKYDELMEQLCSWLNGPDFSDDEHVVYGLVKSVIAHLYLVWIHPFGDGNGRTARLLEARILLEAGIPSTACHLLSDHYNRTRPEYYRHLAEASKNGGDVLPFIDYAITGFVGLLRDQLVVVKNQQWAVSWVNYVHSIFSNRKSKTEKRQRDLLLSLTDAGGVIHRDEIRRLSPIVAEEYSGLTDRTVFRDLNALVRQQLIVKIGDGYRANRELILQFVPRARKGDLAAQLHQVNSLLYEQGDEEEDDQADLFEDV